MTSHIQLASITCGRKVLVHQWLGNQILTSDVLIKNKNSLVFAHQTTVEHTNSSKSGAIQ